MDAPPNSPEEGQVSAPEKRARSSRPYTPPELISAAVHLLASPDDALVLNVSGASMVPTLSDGDAVRLKLGRGRRRFGDVLVFAQAGSVVVHRYLGPASDPAGRPCLRTRGDGHPDLDPPLAPESVLGCVEAVRRDGTWRSLAGTAARAYAAAVALHDLFWAGAVLAARRLGSDRLRAAVQRADRGLLRRVDAWLFRRLHPLAPERPGSSAAR